MHGWFDTEIEWDSQDGLWVSYVHGLGGASTYGQTLAEVLSQTRDMISGYLETARAERISVPGISKGRS